MKRFAIIGEVDALDEKLIALLKDEPRATNRALAAMLGVSEPTVASRISRLEESSQLRVIAVLDTQAAGFEHFAVFGLHIADRHPDQAAVEIAKIPEVDGLTLTLGRFEIVGTMYAQDKADLARLVHRELAGVPGVHGIESGLVLDIHKVNTDIGTLSAMTTDTRPSSPRCVLDPLDLGIIDCLQEDGRMSYREVGRRLHAPEATIRSRLRRLEESAALRMQAVTDVDFMRTQASAWVALRVQGGQLDALVGRLSKAREMSFLGTTLGRFNLIALLVLQNRKALLDFIFEKIAPLHGVHQLETWEVVRIYKHDIRVSPNLR